MPAGANLEVLALSTTLFQLTTISASLGTASTKLPSIDCTQSGGALTFSAVAQYMDFRNVSLTSGTPTTINAAPANLVLPAGASASLGFVTAQAGRIVLVEMNNAGTAELAIANIAGGLDMSEAGVISTTAIATNPNAANVWYSTTARTNLAYRVIGAFDVTWTTPNWGTPTTKINAGGNALSAMSSLGYGQTWQAVTRTSGTTYYNTTGKQINLIVLFTYNGVGNNTLTINGTVVVTLNTNGILNGSILAYPMVTIPAGQSYSFTLTPTAVVSTVSELR
jgi:hypothetical protein